MQKRLWGEAKSEATLIDRYFAAKAFEKTTGDMSEPMGKSLFSSRVELINSLIIDRKVGPKQKRTIYSRSDRELR